MVFGHFDMGRLMCGWGPGCFPVGAFPYHVGSEWADAVAEFVWQGWLGVACEEVSVDYFAEFGEPVAQRAYVTCFEVADALEFVSCLDEPVYFFVLGVYLFFEFALRFD